MSLVCLRNIRVNLLDGVEIFLMGGLRAHVGSRKEHWLDGSALEYQFKMKVAHAILYCPINMMNFIRKNEERKEGRKEGMKE